MTSSPDSRQEVASTFLDRHPAFLPLLIVATFAVVGAGLLPYSYYIFLRWVLTFTAVFIVVHAIRSERLGWLALAIPMFILWAPAAWIILPRAVWQILDVVVGGLLVLAGVLIPAPRILAGPDGKEVVRWQWWRLALVVYGIGALLFWTYSTEDGYIECTVEFDRTGRYCG